MYECGSYANSKFVMRKWQRKCLRVKFNATGGCYRVQVGVSVILQLQLRGEVENTSLVSSGEPLFRGAGDRLKVGERHTLLILCLRYTVFGERPWVGE